MSAPEADSAAAWRPTAALATLRLRAQLLADTRSFFARRGVLEVDTPALVQRAASEPHLHSLEVALPGRREPLFLATSPEYAMKRLLAAGCTDIYQLAHAFRGEEASPLHNAEFMLVEWYRCGWRMAELMQETAELARLLLSLAADAPLESLSYGEAFRRELGLDPLAAPLKTLREQAIGHGMDRRLADACERDELCDWLIAVAIGPRLGLRGLTFLHHYPASQAALARLDPQDPRLALRFELYHRGVELANGFEELTDPAEQARRFAVEQHTRQRRSAPAHATDERLLAALAHGLPPVSGVALGFDRALMLRIGAGTLAEVLPFALERA